MIANATGCSSIYSGSVPSTPYCTDEKGHGPAWANSLFEDFAEFGLGMKLGSDKIRERVADLMTQMLGCDKCTAEMKELAQQWLDHRNEAGPPRCRGSRASVQGLRLRHLQADCGTRELPGGTFAVDYRR